MGVDKIRVFTLLCMCLVCLLGYYSVSASTIYVPRDYSHIQWAIDNATEGGTIMVESGVYREHIELNKQLNLISWDTDGRAVIDGENRGDTVTISAEGVLVQGFKINHSDPQEGAGLRVLSDSNTIADNLITDNAYGIYLNSSTSNKITENSIQYNSVRGVSLKNSSGNHIYLNNFINNHNVYSNSDNIWNTSKPQPYTYRGFQFANILGNHWSDYPGEDIDGNGIGNTPYKAGLFSEDIAPLMKRYENYAPPATTPTPTPTPTLTAEPTSPTPADTTATPTPTPTVTATTAPALEESPGFEIIGAFTGLLMAVYFVRRIY